MIIEFTLPMHFSVGIREEELRNKLIVLRIQVVFIIVKDE